MRYTVHFDIIASYSVEVEANDIPKALELAEEVPVSIVDEDGEIVGYISECNVYRVSDDAGNVVEGDPYM